jgi:hypothetical protein
METYILKTNTVFLKTVIPPDQNENLDLSNDNPIQSLSCAKQLPQTTMLRNKEIYISRHVIQRHAYKISKCTIK